MVAYGLEKARWDATPSEVKRKALGKRPSVIKGTDTGNTQS